MTNLRVNHQVIADLNFSHRFPPSQPVSPLAGSARSVVRGYCTVNGLSLQQRVFSRRLAELAQELALLLDEVGGRHGASPGESIFKPPEA
jgi:hypothetical protein